MASFDVVNKVDMQEMDNAVNNTRKALMNRYDFRGSKTEITLDKKAGKLTVVSEDDMKVMAVQEAMSVHLVKRKIDTKAVIWGEPQPAGGAMRRSEATIAQGIEVDTARKIVKYDQGDEIEGPGADSGPAGARDRRQARRSASGDPDAQDRQDRHPAAVREHEAVVASRRARPSARFFV